MRRPAKAARQLALAHHLDAAIERGLVADQAALARKLGLTRARVTQLFDLLMLAADLQEQVLALEAVDGAEPMAERTLRAVAHAGTWAEQRGGVGSLAGSRYDEGMNGALFTIGYEGRTLGRCTSDVGRRSKQGLKSTKLQKT